MRKTVNEYYVQILHLLPEEAEVAFNVNKRARRLDGRKLGPFRFGLRGAIGLLPV